MRARIIFLDLKNQCFTAMNVLSADSDFKSLELQCYFQETFPNLWPRLIERLPAQTVVNGSLNTSTITHAVLIKYIMMHVNLKRIVPSLYPRCRQYRRMGSQCYCLQFHHRNFGGYHMVDDQGRTRLLIQCPSQHNGLNTALSKNGNNIGIQIFSHRPFACTSLSHR